MKKTLVLFLMTIILSILIFPGCSQTNSTIPTNSYIDNTVNYFINSVNHRGYYTAPENTLSAYKLSKEMGFNMVECDISFTKDNVPVLLHDDTINRTSNGTGKINDLTFEEVRKFDFGSWKNKKYSKEKIPSFYEFIDLCRKLSIHPYIELKSHSTSLEQVKILNDIVNSYGMIDKVTWISFGYDLLNAVKELNSKARIGYITMEINEQIIKYALSLKSETNNVFIDCDFTNINDEAIRLCRDNFLPLEVWDINDESQIVNLNPYISGVTSDSLIAGKVLANSIY